MAINTDSMSLEDLAAAIQQLNQAYYQRQAQQQADADQKRTDVADAISALDALLGPETGDPGIDSIRDIRRFDQQTMADNAGLALDLAFTGLEILTATVRDIAHVIANQNKQ